MVKTTIVLDDELYRKLVKEALDKYGTTRKLSLLINQKLRGEKTGETQNGERLRMKLGRDLKPEEIEKLIEDGWREVIRWKP